MRVWTLVLVALVVVTGAHASPIDVAASANGGVAAQSSTLGWGIWAYAWRANDGNTDGNYNDGSVSSTNDDYHAWWDVTFNNDYLISEIDVFNRTDCCQSRLDPFSVFLYDDAGDVVWESLDNHVDVSIQEISFPVPDIIGRSVMVQLDDTNYLNIAEVEAWGEAPVVPEPATFGLFSMALAGFALGRRFSFQR